MLRLLTLLLLSLALAQSATVRLYLKDGTNQRVREYEVQEDRVRYYSVERSQWEEIPLDLIDLKRTKAEQAEIEADRKSYTEANKAEDEAEREVAREIRRVPPEPGAYWINGKDLIPVKLAESKVKTNKGSSILKAISPLPFFAGKATLEIDGATAALKVAGDRPEFYFRLSAEERFALVRVTPQKAVRMVEKWSTIPVSNELIQEHIDIPIFRHQVGAGLYRIWPQKPAEPGEYAIIQFAEGKGNTQVWDFTLQVGK
ncbi:MAG: hypothetical protein JJE04_25015 [Acidobacteriia bacterium]|nr:hypothetical protein [Terriglobia bacterium]